MVFEILLHQNKTWIPKCNICINVGCLVYHFIVKYFQFSYAFVSIADQKRILEHSINPNVSNHSLLEEANTATHKHKAIIV